MENNLAIANGHRRHSSITAVAAPSPKKLIVCCDGTWANADNAWVKDKFGGAGHPVNPTNVTRLARAIQDQDDGHHQQIVYYQAGVGTGLGVWDKLFGGGTGAGLSENVREAYSFLVSNYSDQRDAKVDQPDSIFLVGFSRGAFTARSIGGFIGALGILERRAMPFFYEIFQDWEHAGDPKHPPIFFKAWCKKHGGREEDMPVDDSVHVEGDDDKLRKVGEYLLNYRKFLVANHLTKDAKIKCIGVWDTVGSLGIPINPKIRKVFGFLPGYIHEYKWLDTTIDNHVENAFQALGLDERRYPFSPAVWERPKDCTTNLKQCWFAGAHSNIGGSYADQGNADITLMWMMDQLSGNTRPKDSQTTELDWIKFDASYITNYSELQVADYSRDKANSRGWAKGTVYDSLTFPQSLAGFKVRKPGQYKRTSYFTSKETVPMINTHEYIHASVRYRIDEGANGVESDWSSAFPHGLSLQPYVQWLYRRLFRSTRPYTYLPQTPKGPLEGWKLEDGRLRHEGTPAGVPAGKQVPAKWVWTSPGEVSEKVLEEDVLGPFEVALKDLDPVARNKMQIDENGVAGRITQGFHPKTI
nr:hypothetical protein B0A51_16960 [Rachicladosporium sp. CCFEE 5018]